MRITKKQLRRVIKEELHRSTSRRGGRKVPHGWSQILPWLTEDSVDDELEHLRSNIEDDKEHIDNLEDDIKDEREEEEHAHEIERHHHHESYRKQWGTDPLNLAELSAPFTQDYVDEEGEFDTDSQDTWFSTGAEDARLYGEADEDDAAQLRQRGVEAEEEEDDLTPVSESVGNFAPGRLIELRDLVAEVKRVATEVLEDDEIFDHLYLIERRIDGFIDHHGGGRDHDRHPPSGDWS